MSPAWEAVLASVDAAFATKSSSRCEEERAGLRALPSRPLEVRRLEIVRLSRQAMVQVHGATYSVPSRWIGLQIHARVGAQDIIFAGPREEYRSPRVRPGQRRVRYAHYFEEISRKPQAVRQVAPELLAELGPAYRQLWRMLEAQHGALETARLFAKLLSVVVAEGSEQVATALKAALSAGRFDLLRLSERDVPSEIAVPETLRSYHFERASAADFDVLLLEAAS